jgi:hypothetical protein
MVHLVSETPGLLPYAQAKILLRRKTRSRVQNFSLIAVIFNVLGFELIARFGKVSSEVGDDTRVNPDGGASNDESGGPPASVVEVGSQEKLLSLFHTTNGARPAGGLVQCCITGCFLRGTSRGVSTESATSTSRRFIRYMKINGAKHVSQSQSAPSTS